MDILKQEVRPGAREESAHHPWLQTMGIHDQKIFFEYGYNFYAAIR